MKQCKIEITYESYMHIDHSTFYCPSQYLSSFPSNEPKSKKFPFLTDFLVRPQKKVSGSFTLNFDATDLPVKKITL